MTRARSLRPATFAAALALVAGCGDGQGPPSPPPGARYDASGRLVEGTRLSVARPNVVMLVLDTVREDAVHPRSGEPAMPRLARWAAGATDFVDASAPAAWTAPSVTTALTGLLPTAHGVKGRMEASPLTPAVATLAEILQSAGYRTLAFTGGGWVSREMGLGQGFESMVEPWSTVDPRKAMRRALAEPDPARPLFLLLHTYEAHDPYGRKDVPETDVDPARLAEVDAEVAKYVRFARESSVAMTPDEGRRLLVGWRSEPLFQSRFAAALERAGLRRGDGASAAVFYTLFSHGKDPQRAQVEATLRARYVDGLGLLDANVETLLRWVDEADLPGRTVTIVVSDHGEAFGEHGALGHGRWLYDPVARVLLMVRAPGRMPSGRVRGSCGVVDVLPTVLDLCGMPAPREAAGRSLVALARGTAGGVPVFAEDYRRYPIDRDAYVVLRVASVRTERAKLILTWDPRDRSVREELYDLESDPGETSPLPADAIARFGAAFVEAAGRARAEVASYATRTDNDGSGRFGGD